MAAVTQKTRDKCGRRSGWSSVDLVRIGSQCSSSRRRSDACKITADIFAEAYERQSGSLRTVRLSADYASPVLLRALPCRSTRLAGRRRSNSFLGQVGRNRSPDALDLRSPMLRPHPRLSGIALCSSWAARNNLSTRAVTGNVSCGDTTHIAAAELGLNRESRGTQARERERAVARSRYPLRRANLEPFSTLCRRGGRGLIRALPSTPFRRSARMRTILATSRQWPSTCCRRMSRTSALSLRPHSTFSLEACIPSTSVARRTPPAELPGVVGERRPRCADSGAGEGGFRETPIGSARNRPTADASVFGLDIAPTQP